jgi:hypothetical protein
VPEHDTRREPVGTVAEETARLVEALGGWAQQVADGHGAAAAHDAAPGAHGGAPHGDPAHAPGDTGPTPGGAPAPGGGTSHCEACGSPARAGEALACQLCPLCQGIALLRAVRPETVDRLADLAGAVAGTLRDLAAERRSEQGSAAPPRGQRVQDIDVDDEDVAAPPPRRSAPGPGPGRPATSPASPDTPSSSQENPAP